MYVVSLNKIVYRVFYNIGDSGGASMAVAIVVAAALSSGVYLATIQKTPQDTFEELN